MVRIKDILDSVEDLMQERFPDHKAYRNMVRQGFERPAFLVAAGKQTMADATARTVDRSMQVKVTLFAEVDDYHDSHLDALGESMASIMELFSCRAISVSDRYLDIGDVTGEIGYDYAECTIPLSWQDDRDLNEPEYQPARNLDLEIEVKNYEEVRYGDYFRHAYSYDCH